MCRLTDDTSCLQKEDIGTNIDIKDVERLPRKIIILTTRSANDLILFKSI